MNCEPSARQDEFRVLITKISQRLEPDRLPEVKFQCSDHIGRGKMEKIGSFIELFTVLEERDVISFDNVAFLMRCLSNIYRKDLEKLVRQYQNSWSSPQSPMTSQQNYPQPRAFSNLTSDGNTRKNLSASKGQTECELSLLEVAPEMKGDMAQPFATSGYVLEPIRTRTTRPLPQLTLDMISFVASKLSYNWQATLRFLGITDEIIDSATLNWPQDFRRQIKECLEYWARTGGQVTRDTLIEATRMTGRNDIAEQLDSFS
ncbi:unnamed protein product [Clavelina lepadiformis]|uniref:Death domain-containing protein n=1 Tax=Clavelina lepadiformis TaxID=159417 RepID=A0ABP0GQ00_CLALP